MKIPEYRIVEGDLKHLDLDFKTYTAQVRGIFGIWWKVRKQRYSLSEAKQDIARHYYGPYQKIHEVYVRPPDPVIDKLQEIDTMCDEATKFQPLLESQRG